MEIEPIFRTIAAVICSCGGEVEEVETTDTEEQIYGCSRDRRCCVRAWQCKKCKTRWTLSLDAPEADLIEALAAITKPTS